MSLTLLAALLVGLALEADGLRIWAERLEMSVLRTAALPITQAWHGVVERLGLESPRSEALALKSSLAERFTRRGEAPRAETPSPVEGPSEFAGTDRVELAQGPVASVAPLQAAAAPSSQGGVQMPVSPGTQIVLAGDSMMAVGLAPVLRRSFSAGAEVRLIKAYRSGTGLARPEVFDWLRQYPMMVGDAQPAVVICSLGANDGQNVQAGKHVLEFGSPAWDDFYRERLTAYLDLLTRGQTRVLWVGMPVMRAPSFARKMQHMNGLVQDVLKRYPSVTWLDPNLVLSSESSAFTQFRSNERGKLIKLRADDGIHMTDDGAAFLLPAIRDWLAQHLPKAQVQAGLGGSASQL